MAIDLNNPAHRSGWIKGALDQADADIDLALLQIEHGRTDHARATLKTLRAYLADTRKHGLINQP